MRIFTAISLPKETKNKVSEIMQGRLPVPYINTTNLHITLNFLGELQLKNVLDLKNIFPKLLTAQKSFRVEFDRLQKFHQQIHLTLKNNPPLEKLQKDLADNLRLNGFELEERTYYPHVKLANLHFDQVLHPERKLESFPSSEIPKLNFLADTVTLYESRLLLHHTHHEPIIECKLI